MFEKLVPISGCNVCRHQFPASHFVFSRAWQNVWQLAPVSCFPALGTGVVFTSACHRWGFCFCFFCCCCCFLFFFFQINWLNPVLIGSLRSLRYCDCQRHVSFTVKHPSCREHKMFWAELLEAWLALTIG